jgi:hypothetical protein
MKNKKRKWIYLLVLMGLLLKFIITGIIVLLSTRGNKEDRPDKLSDPNGNLQNTITIRTQVRTKPNAAFELGLPPELGERTICFYSILIKATFSGQGRLFESPHSLPIKSIENQSSNA